MTLLTTENMMDLLKELWSDDKCVIKRAMKEIANLGYEDHDENEVKMRELGLHSAVFQLIQKHVSCLEILVQGIRALGNFSHNISTKKFLGDVGYVEVILARIEKDPDSEIIQLMGCLSITNLTHRMKDNAERVQKAGGIALVIAAMKAHPNSGRLQRRGCQALSNMSEWEEYRPLIVKAGGASAIASIMEKYWEHPVLHERAYNAMERLFKKPR